MDALLLEKIITLRKSLHNEPELSGNELKTSKKILTFISKYNPDEIIIGIGGYGIACIYHGSQPGDTVLIRADFDAVPVQEDNDLDYRSLVPGVSHQCGHDGHTAILAGLAAILDKNRPKNGRVVLLFQPAEENGSGAYAITQDEQYKQICPDYTFALHNEPDVPVNHITVKSGVYYMASKGIKITLKGTSAHASKPIDGNSPGPALFEIFQLAEKDSYPDITSPKFKVMTTLGLNLQFLSYGTTPREGEYNAVLRAYSDELLADLVRVTEKKVKELGARDNLTTNIRYFDEFPATVNEKTCTQIIMASARKNNLKLIVKEHPWTSSEDFAHIANSAKIGGAIFSLGIGKGSSLHTPEYLFNDEVIPTGIKMFGTIIHDLLG
jgi:amidohydrolase